VANYAISPQRSAWLRLETISFAKATATTAPGGQPVRPVRVKLRDRQLTETTAWAQHCSSSLNSNNAQGPPDCPCDHLNPCGGPKAYG